MPTAPSAQRQRSMLLMSLAHQPPEPLWRRARGLIANNRVAICLSLVLTLVLGELALGSKPHRVTDLGNPWVGAGALLALCSLGLRSWGAGVLCKNQSRARTGPYRYCRHPLYLANILGLAGFCALIGSLLAFAVFVALLAVFLCTIWQEEDYLTARLEWSRLNRAADSSAAAPNSPAAADRQRWSLAQWWQNREYRAILNFLLALILLALCSAWR